MVINVIYQLYIPVANTADKSSSTEKIKKFFTIQAFFRWQFWKLEFVGIGWLAGSIGAASSIAHSGAHSGQDYDGINFLWR